MKLFIMISGLVLALAFTGCATVIKGVSGSGVSKQDVRINSSPDGATCKVMKEGQQYCTVTTPTTVNLPRDGKNYSLAFEKEGYEPQTVGVERKLDAGQYCLGNFILGGLIGLIVDAIDGAAWSLEPSVVNAPLMKSYASASGGEKPPATPSAIVPVTSTQPQMTQ